MELAAKKSQKHVVNRYKKKILRQAYDKEKEKENKEKVGRMGSEEESQV